MERRGTGLGIHSPFLHSQAGQAAGKSHMLTSCVNSSESNQLDGYMQYACSTVYTPCTYSQPGGKNKRLPFIFNLPKGACLQKFLFPPQKFLQKIEEHFACICCQDLVFKPVTTTCLHNVCKVSHHVNTIKIPWLF